MAEMSRRFNFDDFDDLCREALDEAMAVEGSQWEEEKKWGAHDKRPGEIGGVAITPLFREWFGDELPPNDAA